MILCYTSFTVIAISYGLGVIVRDNCHYTSCNHSYYQKMTYRLFNVLLFYIKYVVCPDTVNLITK